MSDRNEGSNHHQHDINWDEVAIFPMHELNMEFQTKEGWILDLGAGGEGIIGLAKGTQVIGIDRNENELRETDNQALNIIMDATGLRFLDRTFNTVTSFFTLMFIPMQAIEQVFSEVNRVLKPNGDFLIWDATINKENYPSKKYFLVQLSVKLPNNTEREARYGLDLRDQDINTFKKMANRSGFTVVAESEEEHTFFLKLRKSS
ncbi:MAG: class I SAM-dependent methyltransferase [Promethearchaeota archaeon]